MLTYLSQCEVYVKCLRYFAIFTTICMISTFHWGHIIKMQPPRCAYSRQLFIQPSKEQCQAKSAVFKGVLAVILPKINLLGRNWVIQVISSPVFGYTTNFSQVAYQVQLRLSWCYLVLQKLGCGLLCKWITIKGIWLVTTLFPQGK